jgi:O-antigen/teichoic acid export membrane protein
MSRLTRNIVYNVAGQTLLLGLGFVAVKYVFKQLGEDALGILFFAQTVGVVLCAVLEMGLGSTTVREVSAHLSSEPHYVHCFLRTGALLFWGGYALLASAVWMAAPLLVHKWIHLRGIDPALAVHALRVLGVGSVTGLPRSFYVSVLRGVQRMEFNNAIDVGALTLQQLGTITVLALGGGLLHVTYCYLACYSVGILAYLRITAHFFSWRALTPSFYRVVVKRNLAYASRMAAISLLSMIHQQADKAVVSKLLTVGTFGYYGLAYGAVAKGQFLTMSAAQAALPSLSALFKAGKREELLAQYRKLQDLICFSTVPVFAAFPFAAIPLFTFVLNPHAARMLLTPITFLCLGFYMNGTLNAPFMFTLAVGRPDIAARVNFYALFGVLPVTVLLVKFFGLPGAGFSWVFYHLFAYAIMMPPTCSECLDMPVWKWYLHLFRIFALAALTYGGAWLIITFVGSSSILSLALGYVFASIAFVAAAYRLIGDELRETLRRLTSLKPAPASTFPLV